MQYQVENFLKILWKNPPTDWFTLMSVKPRQYGIAIWDNYNNVHMIKHKIFFKN
jgi:hypothetical protein